MMVGMMLIISKTATSGLVSICDNNDGDNGDIGDNVDNADGDKVDIGGAKVTLVTSGMVPSETKVPLIGILVPLFH